MPGLSHSSCSSKHFIGRPRSTLTISTVSSVLRLSLLATRDNENRRRIAVCLVTCVHCRCLRRAVPKYVRLFALFTIV